MNVWPLVSPLNLISSLCIVFELIPRSRIRTHMATLKNRFSPSFFVAGCAVFLCESGVFLLFARFDSGERGGAH